MDESIKVNAMTVGASLKSVVRDLTCSIAFEICLSLLTNMMWRGMLTVCTIPRQQVLCPDY